MVQLYVFDRLTSTNSVLLEAARAGAPDGTVLLARTQSAGRGQRDNRWESPPGGLWMSTLVRVDLPAEAAGWLPLSAGLAVADVAAGAGVRVRLKWPNDVVIGDKKVAGVLVESSLQGGRLQHAVVGTGINVSGPAPLASATALSEHGFKGDAFSLALPIARRVLELAHGLASAGPGGVRAAFLERDTTIGRRVRTPDGEGKAVDIGPAGELVLETAKGKVLARAGPVEWSV